MSTEDGRDDRRRVVTGRDSSGGNSHLVMQEVNGYIAVMAGPDPVFLDPLVVSKAIEHMRDLQARALRGVRWDV
jgi:hypothetical protein